METHQSRVIGKFAELSAKANELPQLCNILNSTLTTFKLYFDQYEYENRRAHEPELEIESKMHTL